MKPDSKAFLLVCVLIFIFYSIALFPKAYLWKLGTPGVTPTGKLSVLNKVESGIAVFSSVACFILYMI